MRNGPKTDGGNFQLTGVLMRAYHRSLGRVRLYPGAALSGALGLNADETGEQLMDIDEIKARIRAGRYVYSQHAEIERRADGLTFAQIEEALLSGEILEQYADTGRGESCLIVGFAGDIPIHSVCGWRGERAALITVYIPRAPKFVDPWTRGERTNV